MTAAKYQKFAGVLASSPLLRGAPPEVAEDLLKKCGTASYRKNDMIFDREHPLEMLCILLEGGALVLKSENGEPHVLMNKLSPGGLFGIVTLFSETQFFLTEVRALEKCTVILIPEDILRELFQTYFIICENYIVYLTQRIRFLHTKIEAFTGSSVEKKLFSYLRSHWVRQTDGSAQVSLTVSYTQLAEVLNIGRASLYRVLTELEMRGHLVRQGKILYIPSPEEMMESYCF